MTACRITPGVSKFFGATFLLRNELTNTIIRGIIILAFVDTCGKVHLSLTSIQHGTGYPYFPVAWDIPRDEVVSVELDRESFPESVDGELESIEGNCIELITTEAYDGEDPRLGNEMYIQL